MAPQTARRMPVSRRQNPAWVRALIKHWKMDKRRFVRLETGDLSVIAPALELLYRKHRVPRHRLELRGQFLDRHLLWISPIYHRSRQLYLQTGGRFVPNYMSKVRALTSPTLIDPDIHYTPYQDELVWVTSSSTFLRAFDPLMLKNMKETITPVFHEQNHRVLWKILPPPGPNFRAFIRYLHFAESIAVALDASCSNELGHPLGQIFNLCGVLANFGDRIIFQTLKDRPTYRRYLVAHAYSNYLNMELYQPQQVIDHICRHFRDLGSFALHAAEDAIGGLDVDFVRVTCPSWENQHLGFAFKQMRKRAKNSDATLTLPADPGDSTLFERMADRLFLTYRA
jgi:hypothetical protein